METALESAPEPGEDRRHGRRLCVAPIEHNALPRVRGGRPPGRRERTGASGDMPGQSLGLVPVVSGSCARVVKLTAMQGLNGGELRRLVRSTPSPSRVVSHRLAEYVSINDVGLRKRRACDFRDTNHG
jgi:hypothetical protein